MPAQAWASRCFGEIEKTLQARLLAFRRCAAGAACAPLQLRLLLGRQDGHDLRRGFPCARPAPALRASASLAFWSSVSFTAAWASFRASCATLAGRLGGLHGLLAGLLLLGGQDARHLLRRASLTFGAYSFLIASNWAFCWSVRFNPWTISSNCPSICATRMPPFPRGLLFGSHKIADHHQRHGQRQHCTHNPHRASPLFRTLVQPPPGRRNDAPTRGESPSRQPQPGRNLSKYLNTAGGRWFRGNQCSRHTPCAVALDIRGRHTACAYYNNYGVESR